MEIFGGFMVMMSIISLFLAVVWLVMPFVVFAIKGKQDRTLEVLEGIDKRLSVLEARLLTTSPAVSGIELPTAPHSASAMTTSQVADSPASTGTFAENI